jgi:hypothetical protein
VCEALASTLIAPGLLYVTRAHLSADLKTVAALSLFVVSVCGERSSKADPDLVVQSSDSQLTAECAQQGCFASICQLP